MLEKVNAYFKEKIHLPWLKRHYGKGVCSLQILPHEVLLCYMHPQHGELQIQFCQSLEYEKLPDLKVKLSKWVQLNKVTGTDCSWILTPKHYQLILTEALPVSEAEFQTSIRWKIKDNINMPLEDAIIDKYEVPQLKLGSENKMEMVVVARKSYLDPHAKIIKESGLQLSTIDTNELALHNLTAMFEEDDKTSALIYIEAKKVQLLITYHQKLYFSRFIDITLPDSNADREQYNAQLDRLILEIQRSFDYFQSQWRLPSPNRIFLASIHGINQQDLTSWSQKLSIPVTLFDINNVLTVNGNFPIASQGKYLPVLGGVLRGYVEVHETAD